MDGLELLLAVVGGRLMVDGAEGDGSDVILEGGRAVEFQKYRSFSDDNEIENGRFAHSSGRLQGSIFLIEGEKLMPTILHLLPIFCLLTLTVHILSISTSSHTQDTTIKSSTARCTTLSRA